MADIENDFENVYPVWRTDTTKINAEKSHSGLMSFKLDSLTEYSCTYDNSLEEMSENSVQWINASVWCYPEEKSRAVLVVSFDSDEGTYDWHGAVSENFTDSAGIWFEIFLTCKIPVGSRPKDRMVVYVWSQDKKNIFIDDFRITMFGRSD